MPLIFSAKYLISIFAIFMDMIATRMITRIAKILLVNNSELLLSKSLINHTILAIMTKPFAQYINLLLR